MPHKTGSGVSQSDFPDVNAIVRARALTAQTNRLNELQPGRVEELELQNQLSQQSVTKGEREQTDQERLDIARRRFADKTDATAGVDFAREFPKEFEEVIEAQSARRKMNRKEGEAAAIAIGRMAGAFASMGKEGKTADWQRMRKRVMRNFPGILEDDIPPEPSTGFIRSALTFASGVAEIRKQLGIGEENKFVTVGTGVAGEKQVRRESPRGPVGDVGKPLVAKTTGTGTGSGTGLKTAVSNTIMRQVNNLFGDIFDLENDTIKVIDPTERKKMLGVAERAEVLAETQGMAPLQAVAQAAREAGIDVPKFTKGGEKVPEANKAAGADSEARNKALKEMEAFVNKTP